MIEHEYGKYHAKIYFKKEDVPEAEKKLLDAIMQSYRQRLERESQEVRRTIKAAERPLRTRDGDER